MVIGENDPERAVNTKRNNEPEVLNTMADIHKLSRQVIDYAVERAADVADAAKGKGRSNAVGTRWLVLPAAGAALYALVRSDFGVAGEGEDACVEELLRTNLMKMVRQTTSEKPAQRTTSRSRSTSSTRSRSRRKPSTKRAAATR